MQTYYNLLHFLINFSHYHPLHGHQMLINAVSWRKIYPKKSARKRFVVFCVWDNEFPPKATVFALRYLSFLSQDLFEKKKKLICQIEYYITTDLPSPNCKFNSDGIKIFITNKRHYSNWMHFSFIHISFIVKHFYLINLPKLPQISSWRIQLICRNMQNEEFKGQNWVKYISDILNVNGIGIRWNHQIILKLRNVSTNKTKR